MIEMLPVIIISVLVFPHRVSSSRETYYRDYRPGLRIGGQHVFGQSHGRNELARSACHRLSHACLYQILSDENVYRRVRAHL